MRKRELLKQVWISYDEDRNLKIKCQKASMTESAVIRCLINSYEPREKPDDRFYEVENANNVTDETQKTIGVFKTYWKKVTGVPVKEDVVPFLFETKGN